MLSIVFMVKQSWFVLWICVLSLFVVVGAVPLFRRRESLYMFLLVAVAGLPINIRISYWLVSRSFFSMGIFIGDVLCVMLLCCVFFSVEEIVFGVITRLIWRRQYKIKVLSY